MVVKFFVHEKGAMTFSNGNMLGSASVNPKIKIRNATFVVPLLEVEKSLYKRYSKRSGFACNTGQ